jgi:hypothetical protein
LKNNQLGKEAKMNDKAFFSDQEWRTLQFAPLWVTTAWAGTDGKIGDKQQEILNNEVKKKVDKIFFAFIDITQKFQKRGREFPKGGLELEKVLIEEGWSLLDAVMASAPLKSTKDWAQEVQTMFFLDRRTPLEGLKDVAGLLNRKSSAEHGTEFIEFLLELNQKIGATYKAGFLGLGGKKKKNETIRNVSDALRL